MADNSAQRSTLKEFIASISTIRGDLSNIAAPPFVLADKSTVELPRYWIEHPDLFCAPAYEKRPEHRMLAVLKWFLSSLKGQQYAGRNPSEGTKKPLNSFLGELFVGTCGSDDATRLVAEQVSHHPPVTACYLWNDNAGIRAMGQARQEVTFNGSVYVKQSGYAILHIDKYDEDYLVPLPNVKVKGILSGTPYPELEEPCSIVCSNGLRADIDFSGKHMLGMSGSKHRVEAAVYSSHEGDPKHPIFTVEGSWTEVFEFKDGNGNVVDDYDASIARAIEFHVSPLDKQDPWESRNAWKDVISSLHAGNMQGVADAKSSLENAQRRLRKQAETNEENWKTLFFRKKADDAVAERLLRAAGVHFDPQSTCGLWDFDKERWSQAQKPWRGQLTPYG